MHHRNSLQPPHLKSAYAAQYNLDAHDDDFKVSIDIHDHQDQAPNKFCSIKCHASYTLNLLNMGKKIVMVLFKCIYEESLLIEEHIFLFRDQQSQMIISESKGAIHLKFKVFIFYYYRLGYMFLTNKQYIKPCPTA